MAGIEGSLELKQEHIKAFGEELDTDWSERFTEGQAFEKRNVD